MNDLIKELAEQAGIKESLVVQFKGDTQAYVVQYDELEKFAELIIEEAIRRTRMRKEIAIENDWKLDETMSILEADLDDIVNYHLDEL